MTEQHQDKLPTRLQFAGKSKGVFTRDVQPNLKVELRNGQFRDSVQAIAPGPSIQLQPSVSIEALEPFIRYLTRWGIPRSDMRFRYGSDVEGLSDKLAKGLATSGLSFGGDVAERDDALAKYFVQTKAFRDVRDHKRHIVIGPKGSGKTAILTELSRANEGSSLVITPEHYATEVLSLIKGPASSELGALTTTWKYTLLIEIFRRLVTQQIGDRAALSTLRRFLADAGHLEGELSLLERFLAHLRRITSVRARVGPVEAETGFERAGEMEKLLKLDELLKLVPSLQTALRKSTFTVFVDELDQSWDNSPTANRFLESLLTAAIQLRAFSPNLHVVVFLRSEIFDLLKPHLPQLDKLFSDIEKLQWSYDDLKSLVLQRALESLAIDNQNVGLDEGIRAIFLGSVGSDRMPTFQYLVSRTSNRPREVIQFCNLSLAAALRRGKPAVDAEAVELAEEEWSSSKRDFIVTENLHQHPGLNDLMEHLRGRPRFLTASALDAVLADYLLTLSPAAPNWIRECSEPVDLIRYLYRFEMIGIERAQTGEFKERFDFVFSRPQAKPEQAQSFVIHPGLWKCLECQ